MKRPFIQTAVALLFGIVIGAGAILTLQHVKREIHESLFRTQAAELWNGYRLWVEAGRPSGNELREFSKKLAEWNWTLLEKDLIVQGESYRTLFCDPDLREYRDGSLYVTTNGVVLWEPNSAIITAKELPVSEGRNR